MVAVEEDLGGTEASDRAFSQSAILTATN